MQKDPLISAMVGALLLISIATLVLGIGFELQSRRSRALQGQLLAIQNTRMMTDALLNDTAEYARNNHPAMMPLLQRFGIRIAPQAAAK